MVDYSDVANYNAITNRAQAAATKAYQDAQMRNQGEQIALQKAQFAWQQEMDKAGLTGMYLGQYTMPSQQYFAGAFGSWMPTGPQAGQQTLQGQQTQADIAQNWSNMFGQYYAPGTAPAQGAQTQAAQQAALQNAATVAGLTGMYTAPGAGGPGTQTLAGQNQYWNQAFQQQQFAAQQQQLQQQNAQSYLQLLASLRGPADWAKYQQVLGSTPGGMRDLAAAAMGQYIPGGGATTGVQPQAASLNSIYAQIQGSPNTYAYPGQPQGDMMGWQSSPQSGQAWGTGIGVGQQGTTADQQLQATGNGTNMYGAQSQQYNLPAPNQIAPQSWNNMAPSQQQMLLGQYEAQGWDKNDVLALRNQALPKYASNSPTAGTWRLQ